jgi:succinoglycan biosynthesis transport protein ExoP
MQAFRPRSGAEYFVLLWRRKWLILLYASGIALAALIVVNAIPNVYESEAVLVVSERATKDPALRSVQISTARQRAMSTAQLKELIELHHLRGATETINSAVQRLRKEIRIEAKFGDSQPQVEALNVAYRSQDPNRAQEVVRAVVSALDQTNDTLGKRAEIESGWLNSQIKQLESQFTELSVSSAGRVLASLGLSGADPETARLTLTSAIDSLNDKQYSLEQQLAEEERQMQEQRKFVVVEQSAPAVKGGVYGASGPLLARKTELTAQLRDYALQYTEKNPKVLQAKAQLSEIDRQLSALGTKDQMESIPTPAALQILALERNLVHLRTDLELTKRDLAKKQGALDAVARVYGSSSRGEADSRRSKAESVANYDRIGRRYSTLVEQRDELQRAGLFATWEPPLFQVMDPASLPEQPVGPNRLKLRGAALVLGLGFAFFIAMILEGRKLFFIQDSDDLTYFLGVPVLGVIPETFSSEERGLRRRQLLASRFGIALLAASIPAMGVVMRHFDFLQLGGVR